LLDAHQSFRGGGGQSFFVVFIFWRCHKFLWDGNLGKRGKGKVGASRGPGLGGYWNDGGDDHGSIFG
jgi:hypothetical protein